MARCTLLVSFSSDLDHCFVFVDQVGVFLEHVHRTIKASECFTLNFPIISVYFAWLLALLASTRTVATYT